MVEYSVESFETCIPEIKALCELHYQEIAEHKDEIPLDPDWDRYIAMEASGSLFFATVRNDGEMIGYYIAIVVPHLHYKSSLTAYTDIFFIRKEYRAGRRGYELFKFVIEKIRNMGVQRFYVGCKVKHDLTKMLTRLGFAPIEHHFAMVFGGDQ